MKNIKTIWRNIYIYSHGQKSSRYTLKQVKKKKRRNLLTVGEGLPLASGTCCDPDQLIEWEELNSAIFEMSLVSLNDDIMLL